MARRSDIIGVTDATGTTFAVNAITVTDAATKIPTSNLDNRKAISIRNFDNTNTIYIGNSNVTTATGFPILPYESLPFDLSNGANIYAICETGKTASVRTIEIDNG
jgi:hypothetical protein